MKRLPILFLCTAVLLLTGCLKDDEYTTSNMHRLKVSVDTIAFDTIISGQPTNTYTFTVYNNNDKSIRISRAYLDGGTASPFKVNIDGSYLVDGNGGGYEIGAKDSMRIFLFANVADEDSDQPIAYKDVLHFITEGGAESNVVLTAYGQSVITMKSVALTSDSTFSASRPYQIYDSLVVAEGATLTVNAGSRLYFHPKAKLIVRGRLVAIGSSTQPIMFRGDRLGEMFDSQPYDRIPAQWGGIIFTGSSFDNIINHCDIHSGTFGIQCDSSNTDQQKLTIENSIIHNMGGDCLTATMCKIYVGNSQISNALGNCVTLRGGAYDFIQCTIANFYAFRGGRGVALSYTNFDKDNELPLTAANFKNCLITGFSKDEIMGSKSDNADIPFSYLFQNCLLNTEKTEDAETIINCQWDTDDNEVAREKNFTPEFDYDQLIFYFTLNEKSLAVNNGDPAICSAYPLDLNGKNRTDGRPDIGCYEMIPQETSE